MDAIDATDRTRRVASLLRRALLIGVGAAIVMAFAGASMAFAGKAATGEPLFYPCTSCHPVVPGRKLPNDFKGHQIKLVVHDKLGSAKTACLVCHEDAAKNPGKLKLIDGSLIDITGDVSLVCYRCHSAKYKAWKAGGHGKPVEKCTSAGCHDPHTPGYIYAPEQAPFVGTGFQVNVRPETAAFKPLPAPAGPAPTETPSWFVVAASLGMLAAGGTIGVLLLGRPKR